MRSFQRHHSSMKLQCFQAEVDPGPSTQDVQRAPRQSQTSTMTVSIFFPQTVKCEGFPTRRQINILVRAEAPGESWSHSPAWSLHNLLPEGITFESSQMCWTSDRWSCRQAVCQISLRHSHFSSRRADLFSDKQQKNLEEKRFHCPVRCDAAARRSFIAAG